MNLVRKTGVAVIAAALVVLMPIAATPAAAVTFKPPVVALANLPSQVVRAVAGGEVMAFLTASTRRVIAGGPAAVPLTGSGTITRGSEGASLFDGVAGFVMDAAKGLGLYGKDKKSLRNELFGAACGSGWEGALNVMYFGMGPECVGAVREGEINLDAFRIPAGFTSMPRLVFGAGTSGSGLSHTAAAVGVSALDSTAQGVYPARVDFRLHTEYEGQYDTRGRATHLNATIRYEFETKTGTWSGSGSEVYAPAILGEEKAVYLYGYNALSAVSNTPITAGVYPIEYTLRMPATRPSTSTFTGRWRIGVHAGFEGGGESRGWAYYYPPGHENRPNPEGTSGNPVREAQCQVTWPDGTVTTKPAGTYQETSGLPLGTISSACEQATVEQVRRGIIPKSVEVKSINTETGQETTLIGQTPPTFTEQEKVGLTPGNGTGLVLALEQGGKTTSCMTWEANCEGWWERTRSGTVPTTAEGTFGCAYGGRSVPLAECGVYRFSFELDNETPVITDPTTGEEVEWFEQTDPANQYGSGPGTAPGTAPGSGTEPSQCVTSFTLNPVDWVLRPIRCAFEPRASKVEAFQLRMDRTWRGSLPGQLAVSVAGIGTAFTAVGDGHCRGIVVGVPILGPDGKVATDQRPVLQACPGDMLYPYASVLKVLTGLGMSIVAVFGVRSMLDRFVNN